MPSTVTTLQHKPPHIAFGTKAETLERIAPVIKTARVLEQFYFTVAEWNNNQAAILNTLSAKGWDDIKLVVRSSALCEDSSTESMAGHFVSYTNVLGQQAIIESITGVIASYDDEVNNQILVQPQLADVAVSGVAFSCDPSSSGPYRIINYDEASGSTESVTSGSSNALQCYYHHRLAPTKPQGFLSQILETIDELEKLLDCQHLDIEFALNSQSELFIFQARPLTSASQHSVNLDEHSVAITRIQEKISQGIMPHPYLHGTRTVYGVMPDWNPAEIIGVRPRQLAWSLYRELVTNAIWAYQRDNYGYRNLRSFPLLVDFEKLPYIDVRVSFNSFLPKELPKELASKLVNYYIDTLIQNPALHDKVEFKIVFSCYTLDLKDKLVDLKKHGFSDEEMDILAASLCSLTNEIIHNDRGLWKKDLSKIEELTQRQHTVLSSELDTLSKIYWLIEDCKRYGTLPFAGLARAAFIATQMLDSLVSKNIISQQEREAFLASVDSVSSQMERDFSAQSKSEFLAKYGRLRPGTYDILSARYDEAPDRYFDWSAQPTGQPHKAKPEFHLSAEQLSNIQTIIDEDRIDIDAADLLSFIKTAIESREMAKFVFTQSVSECLKLIEHLASEHGITRDECAHLYIADLLALHSSSGDVAVALRESIARGKRYHQLARSITLPPIIINPDEAWSFHVPNTVPNFITQNEALGPKVFADASRGELKDAILMIPSADPGFDWVFSHGIKGFITKYGGANSHMSVRAAELGIPAVIGAGELLYDQWSRAKILHIDCVNHQVQVVQ